MKTAIRHTQDKNVQEDTMIIEVNLHSETQPTPFDHRRIHIPAEHAHQLIDHLESAITQGLHTYMVAVLQREENHP